MKHKSLYCLLPLLWLAATHFSLYAMQEPLEEGWEMIGGIELPPLERKKIEIYKRIQELLRHDVVIENNSPFDLEITYWEVGNQKRTLILPHDTFQTIQGPREDLAGWHLK